MSPALQDGALFAGRYRILRRIAIGGMGAVYEVLHLETERRRALKVMLPHILQSEDLRERFKREAKVAAHIDSEFIVEVFDAGVDEATQMPFLVMELLRGEELGKRLKRLGAFPPADVVAYLHQTALALDRTHGASIVHRDLKPENLFLTEREDGPPRVKVLDFGVAKVVAESATTGVTQSIGTPMYMAPEQYNPSLQLTGAADVYALGMVAYTFLTGGAYWAEETRGGNVFALATVAMHGPREPASARAARRGVVLPPGFDAWFARITAVSPAHRFASASEAVRALADALGSAQPVRGAAISLVEPAAPRVAPAPLPEPATIPLQAMLTATTTTTTTPIAASRSRASLLAGVGLGAAVLIGAGLYLGWRQPGASASLAAGTAPTSSATANARASVEPAATATIAPTATAPVTAMVTSSSVAPPDAKAPGSPAKVTPTKNKKSKYSQD